MLNWYIYLPNEFKSFRRFHPLLSYLIEALGPSVNHTSIPFTLPTAILVDDFGLNVRKLLLTNVI